MSKLNRCVYCGKPNPETKDHVPPKCLFSTPRPSNLVRVPCCIKCHSGTSDDDQYFRDRLGMNLETYFHPDVQGILPSILRSFDRPQQKNYTLDLINSLKEVELVTKSGIYIGNTAEYPVDRFRLGKVVERTVRGLFWKERNKIYPINGYIKSYILDSKEQNASTYEKIASYKHLATTKIIGKDNTVIIRMIKGNEEYLEFWLLTFYEKIDFIVFLIPNKEKISVA